MNKILDDLLKTYKVEEHGVIISPGKFEGEMIYVPYYWELSLHGFADYDDGKILGFNISSKDRAIFGPMLKGKRTVRFYERNDGLVFEI
jgi:hypothetical protein